MRKIRRWTPKEKRDEIVLRYLSGDNSVEELGEYYNVNPSTIRTWVKRFRQSKNVVSLHRQTSYKDMPSDTAKLAIWHPQIYHLSVLGDIENY